MERFLLHRRSLLPRLLRLGAAAGIAISFAACTSSDSVRAAQRALNRAFTHESTAAFFEPVLARAQGTAPAPVPPHARQYYLMVVAEMQMLNERGLENLKRNGLLGDAYTMKLLAQWRLGRIDGARTTLQDLRASAQEALNPRDRWLVAAFAGADQIDRAIAAAHEGARYAAIHELIAGTNGAWRALAAARAVSARIGPPPPELLETRLAAFKVLQDAHERAPDPTMTEAWTRMRAEAQFELNEFSMLVTGDAAAHAARVRHWRTLCGLDAPPR